MTGLPTEVQLRSEEVREAIATPMQEVLRALSGTLEDTPPELAGDITREGILLAGGGTLLRGLPALVTEHTGMAVSIADSPLTCVAIGSGLALEHFDHIATWAEWALTETDDWPDTTTPAVTHAEQTTAMLDDALALVHDPDAD